MPDDKPNPQKNVKTKEQRSPTLSDDSLVLEQALKEIRQTLDSAKIVRLTDQGVPISEEDAHLFTYSLSGEIKKILSKIVLRTHSNADQILSQGIILLEIAIKAKENGLRLMIVDENGNPVTEIVDFGEEQEN